jgi:hypothetical protein
MASRTKYTAIPAVPLVGVPEWQSQLLNALKENVELLTGTRGEEGLASAAVTGARLSVSVPPAQTMVRVSARGQAITISGVTVPLSQDYNQLLSDVQKLANDVATLRNTVELLIRQLKG